MAEPMPGTAPGTVIYREKGSGVNAVVNAATGRIIAVWRK
jgi:hypothetical protein